MEVDAAFIPFVKWCLGGCGAGLLVLWNFARSSIRKLQQRADKCDAAREKLHAKDMEQEWKIGGLTKEVEFLRNCPQPECPWRSSARARTDKTYVPTEKVPKIPTTMRGDPPAAHL